MMLKGIKHQFWLNLDRLNSDSIWNQFGLSELAARTGYTNFPVQEKKGGGAGGGPRSYRSYSGLIDS